MSKTHCSGEVRLRLRGQGASEEIQLLDMGLRHFNDQVQKTQQKSRN
jgi:hypothetical protein